MENAEELEDVLGITPERIAEIDADAERGVLPGETGETATGPGRPLKYDAAMERVSFRDTASAVRSMDERAAQLGMRRSDYLRQLVHNDLACVAVQVG